jgi:transposase
MERRPVPPRTWNKSATLYAGMWKEKIAKQVTTNPDTRICAVDLNLDTHLAVCTIQTAEGTILATKFIAGGQEINGFRKKLLGRIARHRSQTGLIAQGEQDNKALWEKIRNADENLSHQVSARIVQFAKKHGATILVFEHLGKLRTEKGTYSRRGNSKRASLSRDVSSSMPNTKPGTRASLRPVSIPETRVENARVATPW